MQGRIDHADWTCPICDARNPGCIECSGLGTAEAYYRTQELHVAAIEDESGTAAVVLEKIDLWPTDCPHRAYWVDRMITGALRQIGRAA